MEGRRVKLFWWLAMIFMIAPGAWAAGTGPQTINEDYATCEQAAAQPQNDSNLRMGLTACSALIAEPGLRPLILAQVLAARGWIRFHLAAFQGENLDALADFNAALTIVPDFPDALAGRAELFLNSGHSQQAVADYTKAIAALPQNAGLLLGRGDAYNNLGQYDLGIADFDAAIKLDPGFAEAMNDRAWALDHQGHYQAALRGYDAALAIAGPLRGLVLSNRCETKMHMGNLTMALPDCNAAIAADPSDSDSYATRGQVNLQGRNYRAAIADYTVALKLAPNDPFSLFARGVARLEAGQEESGRADIKAAEQLRPSIQADMAKDGILLPSGS